MATLAIQAVILARSLVKARPNSLPIQGLLIVLLYFSDRDTVFCVLVVRSVGNLGVTQSITFVS